MSTVVFRRPPRQNAPELPEGTLAMQEPPQLPERQAAGFGMLLQMVPMLAGAGAMSMMVVGPQTTPMTYIGSGMMGLSMFGMMFSGMGRGGAGDRKRTLNTQRRDYLRYLSTTRRTVREAAVKQRKAMRWRHPEPQALWAMAGSARLWERRAADPDFSELRIGTGTRRLALILEPPVTVAVEYLEQLCARALRSFMRAHSTLDDLPTAVFLRAFARVLIRGDRDEVLALTRAMLAQAAVAHSPTDLKIIACVTENTRRNWDWLKWLPHTAHPAELDIAGSRRMVVTSIGELEDVLSALGLSERGRFDAEHPPSGDEPYLLVVVDGVTVPPSSALAGPGLRNVTVIDTSEAFTWRADPLTLRLRINRDHALEAVAGTPTGKEKITDLGRPDQLSDNEVRALAKFLARFRMPDAGTVDEEEPLNANIDLPTMLGIPDVHTFDPHSLWNRRTTYDRLRVAIAIGADGAPIELDIKESAQGGMGPHGMLVGATGSGKSELLRTLVLALACTHSSEILNFVLVDFKGGATFVGLDQLPHTSAMITNLADELPLVDRMEEALQGEMVRRQELLRAAGYASQLDYEKARAAGADIAPLPALFLVLDEFSELLSAKREFLQLFVMVGRLGRSLGVHLLLATQRIEEGRVHALEGHLSYRLGLRMFSAAESRGVLGITDAYSNPLPPGGGYLKTDNETIRRFKAAYVSAPAKPPRGTVELTPSGPRVVSSAQIVELSTEQLAPVEIIEPEPVEEPDEGPVDENESVPGVPTMMQILIERMRDAGPPAHRVWLPPLSAPSTLDELLPGLRPEPDFGLIASEWDGCLELRVPLGIVDRPFEQRWDLLQVDLGGANGSIAIGGGSHSGKSTLVRTMMMSLALTHRPCDVQFYCLDFGGGSLSGLRNLPHVGGVAGRLDAERVSRTVAEMTTLLNHREQLFADHAIESMHAYRRLRRQGEFADEQFADDVFLVIDGWYTIKSEFDGLEAQIQQLVARGLTYGVHLIVTTARWADMRSWLRDGLGSRLELRLGDPVDSVHSSRIARLVPEGVPGRGVIEDGKHFLTALPRIDGDSDPNTLSDGVRSMVDQIRQAWSGPSAPPVRLLPTSLDARDLPAPTGGENRAADLQIPIGLTEDTLEPLWHDFGQSSHLVVYADNEMGKTNLLRHVAQSIVAQTDPKSARVMVCDYRRQLFDAVPVDHQAAYAVSANALQDLVADAAGALVKRMPGPDVTPDRLSKRDWWVGPQLFILIDDYDLVSTGGMSPLTPLLDMLAVGADIGLHVIIARAASGAGRAAMGDSVLRRIWDIGSPVVLMSCPREEGSFVGGYRPETLPPGRARYLTRRGQRLFQTPHLTADIAAAG